MVSEAALHGHVVLLFWACQKPSIRGWRAKLLLMVSMKEQGMEERWKGRKGGMKERGGRDSIQP